MNIGIFSDTFTPEISGVVSSIETLREELEKRGHHVYVFTVARPDAPRIPGVFRLPSMPLLFLKSLRFAIFYTPRAARCVRRVHLDIIHTQTEFSLGLFGKLMGLMHGIPVVHTYHTLYKDYTHYVTKGHFMRVSQEMVRLFTRSFCNDCRLVIAPTEKVAALLKEYGVRRPLRVIPSGIRLDRFMAAAGDPDARMRARQEFGIGDETPLLVYIGRLAKEKSIGMLLEAMPRIRARLPHTRLLLVGDGPDRESLSHQVRQLGLADAVIFAGARPWKTIPDCYRAGDVFVSASTTETQGLTVLEAMATGVPVVVRDDPSFRSMVNHGHSGLLFDETDALADGVLRVLTEPGYAESLRTGANESLRRYSAEAFGESIETAYREAMTLPASRFDVRSFRVVGQASRLSGRLKTRLENQFRRLDASEGGDKMPRFGKYKLGDVIRQRMRRP